MKREDEELDREARLTAYALGELDDDERAEVERLLAVDSAARALVEEMRALGTLVTDELARDPALDLTPAQRARIEEAARPARRPRRVAARLGPILAVAAGVAVIITIAGAARGWFGETEDSSPFSDPGFAGDGDRVASTETTKPPEEVLGDIGYAKDEELREPQPTEALARASSGGFRQDQLGITEPAPPVDLRAQTEILYSKERATGEDSEPTQRIMEVTGPGGIQTWQLKQAARNGVLTSDREPEKLNLSVDGRIVVQRPSLYLSDERTVKSIQHGGADFERESSPGVRYLSTLASTGRGTESYDALSEHPFIPVASDPRSTFAVDVDTASYANVRRFLRDGQLPPPGAVRIEEMVNYFAYDYPDPEGEHPFAAHVEVASAPWAPRHRLVRIALQGRRPGRGEPKARNLVFLVDVSGSMGDADKLPLVRQSLALLVDELGENDRIAIVTYADDAGVALPSTRGHEKDTLRRAIEHLASGGSTNGGAGIDLAYREARAGFLEGGVNRVLLATDGDFNVGITDRDDLVRLIEEEAQGGVFLSILGFGTGNLKDSQMEAIADHGNGQYSYVDSLTEARKVLVEEMAGTLETIAKDVKVQVEFNPRFAAAWRLIGYENRALAHRDFADDRKDAGEIGAGHAVTALYEVVPPKVAREEVATLKYQRPAPPPTELSEAANSDELLTVKLRYQQPTGTESRLLEVPVVDRGTELAESSPDFRFAAAVAELGMLLRHSAHAGSATFEAVRALAAPVADDPRGCRQEFLRLVDRAQQISNSSRR